MGYEVQRVAGVYLGAHAPCVAFYVAVFVLALGGIVHQPRYYEYISRLAPPGQQGTYIGFAFLPLGIGSLIGGWFGGMLVLPFGEITHHPERVWFSVEEGGLSTAGLYRFFGKIVWAIGALTV